MPDGVAATCEMIVAVLHLALAFTARHPLEDGGCSLTTTLPALLLRLEGAAVLVAATLLYWEHGGSWLLFALLFVAPDLSMIGYLAGPRVGAAVYNLFHTVTLPVVLAVVGLVGDQGWAVSVGLVWLAHLDLDRLVGYGLKSPEGFKKTHLARV